MVPFRKGADGVVSHKITLHHVLCLTTPAAALRWLRSFLLLPQPPFLGKEGKRSIKPFSPLQPALLVGQFP